MGLLPLESDPSNVPRCKMFISHSGVFKDILGYILESAPLNVTFLISKGPFLTLGVFKDISGYILENDLLNAPDARCPFPSMGIEISL